METTRDLVRGLFDYEDGMLFWKVSKANNRIKMKTFRLFPKRGGSRKSL